MWKALATLGGKIYTAQQAKNRAKDKMNFQRDMSNTAYQRAMADMKSAGINPIMVSKLGGASTPSGAMAPVPDFGKVPLEAMQASNAYNQAKLNKANADLATQDFDILKSRGLSKSILAGNPLNLLINSAMNNLSKVEKREAIKGLLELIGIKTSMANSNSANDAKIKYERLKKLTDEMERNRKNIKEHYDSKKHKYKNEYLYPDRILRKFKER